MAVIKVGWVFLCGNWWVVGRLVDRNLSPRRSSRDYGMEKEGEAKVGVGGDGGGGGGGRHKKM